MGSSFSRDDNIDIYMSTNKEFYVAGQYVEGEVYLNVKAARNYRNLSLKIEGEQYVFWVEGGGKNTRFYTDTYKNYQCQTLLIDFQDIISQGQYVFPFSLLLPSMMSGSFMESKSCYIKYIFKAILVHPTQEKKSQVYQMFLNILEPPRSPFGPLSITNNVNSKCCTCCCDYGITAVILSSDKNFVRNGDTIQLNGKIDNTRGTQKIKSWRVVLQQNRVMIASSDNQHWQTDNQYVLLENGGQVQKGESRNFNFNAIIPANIFTYTAIGRIVSRYFVIYLDTSYGCCSNTAQAYLHLVVHSKTPLIVQKKRIPPPQNWNPKTYPPIQLTNLKPFVYTPDPSIPFLNMPGQQNVVLNSNPNSGYPSMTSSYKKINQIQLQNIPNQFNYNPVYYNQNMFTDEQKRQQGYQPYFQNQISQTNLLMKS